jgi:hypothetical protein
MLPDRCQYRVGEIRYNEQLLQGSEFKMFAEGAGGGPGAPGSPLRFEVLLHKEFLGGKLHFEGGDEGGDVVAVFVAVGGHVGEVALAVGGGVGQDKLSFMMSWVYPGILFVSSRHCS